MDTGETFTDVTSPKEEVTVGPVEDMHEFESRKLGGFFVCAFVASPTYKVQKGATPVTAIKLGV